MRVNPDHTADFLAAIEFTRRQESTAMQQLSTGLRVNQPSDDPATAAFRVQNARRNLQADSFLTSISSLQALLQTADSSLSSVVTTLQQAVNLGIEGANGTQNNTDRKALAESVRGIQQQILGLANLTFQGNYVFAGTATRIQPFAPDESSPSGVVYRGNSQVNLVEVGENRSLRMNMPGDQLFSAPGKDVFQALNDLVKGLDSGDANAISTATEAVRSAMDHVSQQRVFFGNNLGELESDSAFLKAEQLQWAQEENARAGADQAAAISSLLNAEAAQQATYSAAARLLHASLLDYLD
jgi:flagellar hook-associated protein 3 FlgL